MTFCYPLSKGLDLMVEIISMIPITLIFFSSRCTITCPFCSSHCLASPGQLLPTDCLGVRYLLGPGIRGASTYLRTQPSAEWTHLVKFSEKNEFLGNIFEKISHKTEKVKKKLAFGWQILEPLTNLLELLGKMWSFFEK